MVEQQHDPDIGEGAGSEVMRETVTSANLCGSKTELSETEEIQDVTAVCIVHQSCQATLLFDRCLLRNELIIKQHKISIQLSSKVEEAPLIMAGKHLGAYSQIINSSSMAKNNNKEESKSSSQKKKVGMSKPTPSVTPRSGGAIRVPEPMDVL